MRLGLSDDELKAILLNALDSRPKDGFEAEQKRKEKNPVHESMATIGG